MTDGRQYFARDDPSPFARVPFVDGQELVAAGGRLEADWLLDAYAHGCFPMGEDGRSVLWWSPDPRGVLPLEAFHVPRRLQRTLDSGRFEVRVDGAFEEVMRGCADDRRDGAWIHEGMVRAYAALHRIGRAHSVEVYEGERLVGGTYGVVIGSAFAAESKFHRVRDASKVALAALVARLVARAFTLLDVQWRTPHLAQFGVVEVSREEYLRRLANARLDAREFA